MFSSCSNLVDTTKCTIYYCNPGSFNRMFANCVNLERADVDINNPAVRNASGGNINSSDSPSYNSSTNMVTISNSAYQTTGTYNFAYMYLNCKKLKYVGSMSFLVHKLSYYTCAWGLQGMFAGCDIEELSITFNVINSNDGGNGTKINFHNMFFYSGIKRLTFIINDQTTKSTRPSEDVLNDFLINTANLTYVSVPGIKKMFTNGITLMNNAPDTGTLVISNDDGISAGSNGVPATWTVEYALN